jgi:hypothetical protein
MAEEKQFPIINDEEKEKARLALAEAQKRASETGQEAALESAIRAKEEKEMREALGLDLDFDPQEFITKGIISKKGIKVTDKLIVDMKTLSTKDRMLAEALVKEEFGNMKLDAVYLTAIEAAILAVAITRVNNQPFPIPTSPVTTEEQSKAYADAYEGKRRLFKTFLEANNDFISVLSVIYKNLENLNTPTEEVQKKS